jgi:TatA/E family protein of Tat protein translocase
VATNTSDDVPFDANLTRAVVHNARLVRRKGRTVCLVIQDDRPPVSHAPSDGEMRQREANANGTQQNSQESPLEMPTPAPRGSRLADLAGCSILLLGLAGAILVIYAGFGNRFSLGPQELIILLIIGVLLFGGNLPEVGQYLGKGIVEFKKGIKGLEDDCSLPLADPEARWTFPAGGDQGLEDDGLLPLAHRATVRYYSRMNPERVYPLLVLVTRDMVEKVHKKHTDQRTSDPFTVDVDAPVEIEPVLPGCDCHPPRVVTRLGQGDLTLTFRVVPRVLGKVDGAVVYIRQDHTSLAEIEMGVKVVKRTGVALAGLVTVLLPGLSAVMKHFGLDFETQKDQGFSLYLATARLVFDRVSPYALTAVLGVATALLWWLTRPRRRDVFWDIKKVGSGKEAVEPPSPCSAWVAEGCGHKRQQREAIR